MFKLLFLAIARVVEGLPFLDENISSILVDVREKV
jgi:hypothetical protein